MALKAYSFTRINEKGAEEACYLTFAQQNCNWKNKTFSVFFENFASQEEAVRKIIRIQNNAPTPIATEMFSLTLSGSTFLAKAMQSIPKDEQNLPFLLIFSNRIWEMALETPFISDYSEIDKDGNRVEILKSLNDLKATLHEIEL